MRRPDRPTPLQKPVGVGEDSVSAESLPERESQGKPIDLLLIDRELRPMR
jgi:hypothetical protein